MFKNLIKVTSVDPESVSGSSNSEKQAIADVGHSPRLETEEIYEQEQIKDDQGKEIYNPSHGRENKEKINNSSQPKTYTGEEPDSYHKGFVLFVCKDAPIYPLTLLIDEDAILALGVSERSGQT